MQNLIEARPGLLMGLIACAALAACGGGDGQDDSAAQNEGDTRANALATPRIMRVRLFQCQEG